MSGYDRNDARPDPTSIANVELVGEADEHDPFGNIGSQVDVGTLGERTDALESSRGVADGIATLDGDGQVPADQLGNATGGGVGTNGDAPTPAFLGGETDDTPLTHTWATGDLADESSWYGAYLVHFEEWTAAESGEIFLAPPAWDGSTGPSSEVDYYIFEGTIAESPDRDGVRPSGSSIADAYWSYNTGLGRAEGTSASFDVVADTTYTLAVINYEALDAVDRVVSLREWALSVSRRGGGPQLFSWRLPDGGLARAEGFATSAEGDHSHAEGLFTRAEGENSHAEGQTTHAEGAYSHAEGSAAHAEGLGSHAEGNRSHAGGSYSHAEGTTTGAEGAYSHAEGSGSRAEGAYSHAEGQFSRADGVISHAEGDHSRAEGVASHAEGAYGHARNAFSHARGGGQFAAPGDSQYLSTELKGIFALSGGVNLPLAANRVIALRGMVAARATDGTIGAAWLVKAAARTDETGSVVILGTPDIELLGGDAGTETWDIDIGPGAGSILFTTTGTDGLNANWSMTLETKEVG